MPPKQNRISNSPAPKSPRARSPAAKSPRARSPAPKSPRARSPAPKSPRARKTTRAPRARSPVPTKTERKRKADSRWDQAIAAQKSLIKHAPPNNRAMGSLDDMMADELDGTGMF